MLSVFQRMGNGVLAVMGEDSVLRGDTPCRVNIEHGVQVVGDDETVVVEKSVATISATVAPRVGDVLVHPDGTFKLDATFQNNGVTPRFILVKYTPPVVP